ncbi:ATP phosphoribosyltransferase [Clostridium cavendishii DSM 21758]|uniref:ATP phosphoribosyltransferase n=1 Tax=Clostridium cavendishii DSM 21758 TaxID=1121302 RepID=A0A1M6F181_9CLOT|nr:ATP phosphoribosyltransferase [Clostridium cavendishii]SHI91488.1 ATP phosphoribosyltransferase [Clostridium cavendishii DSM 21758]
MALNIALTKGRLEISSLDLFEKAGFNCSFRNNKGRKLIFKDLDNDISYFLVKANDAITYVEHGVADLAVVGKDSLLESSSNYYELLDLNIGKCKFILAGLKDNNIFSNSGHIKIATKYPKVAKGYFKTKNMDVEIIKIEGSVEIAPLIGLCNGIVDIMETGTTLKENGLIVLDEILNISARLIANRASFNLKQKEIVNFLERISSIC